MNKTRTAVAMSIMLGVTLGGCVAFDDSSDLADRVDNCARTPGCTSSASPSGYGSQQSRSVDPVGPGGVSPRH